MPDSPRVIPLPGGRLGRLVPTDRAGEDYLKVSHTLAEQLHEHGLLSGRQAEALDRLRGLHVGAGRKVAGRQNGLGEPRTEEEAKRAGDELDDLLGRVPRRAINGVLHILATDEYPPFMRVSDLKEAMTAVADRLRLADY